jgi:cell division protein FtsI/penicillin-binding protein 2
VQLRRSLAVTLGMVLLAGCANDVEPEKVATPHDAADTLAAALSKGSVEGIRVREGKPKDELPVLLEGMNGMVPEVTVAHVSPSAQVANVKLDYRWPLSSPWTYQTDAVLVREGTEWQLNWEPSVLHPKLTAETRLERQRGDASERGNITGRDDAVLVESIPVQMLGLDKSAIEPDEVEDSARRVAEKAEIDPDAFITKAHHAGAQEWVDAVPVRSEDLPADFLAIPGAALRTVTMPAPRTAGYAHALIGRMGYATAEDVTPGSEIAIGELVGVSGLQKTYDKQLRGSTGNKVFLAQRDEPIGVGRPTNATLLADFPDVPGNALETTIDDTIQTAAEDAVKNLTIPVSVVVLRIEDGAIMAAADSPDARITDESTTGAFSPGLAAAPVSALALARSGVDLTEQVDCEDEVTVGSRTFENPRTYRGSTKVTLSRAFSDGCLTAIASAAERLDGAKLSEAATSLGLGQDLDLGIPNSMGAFPAPADAVAKAEALTGAGAGADIRASALAMATMAASVEAKQVVSPFVVPGREPKVEDAVPLTDAEAKALSDLMRAGASSYRPLTGATSGSSDGRVWAVGQTADYAVAVVIADDGKTRTTPAQIVRTVANSTR